MGTRFVRFDDGDGARWAVVVGDEARPLVERHETTAALL
ncbi:MAG: DUF2437 domain-containing protein, partial [Planctomycetes bacterium]|nr:DUF2437 domain-containing protein [Planctomycetota bacterium]